MTLFFGSFEPMVAFAALAQVVSPQNAAFYNVPEAGASFIFELYTLQAEGVDTYPDTSDIFVRFLYQNGTGSDSSLVEYPLFGLSPSQTSITLVDFIAGLENFMIFNVEDWCTTCNSFSVFCPAFTGTDGNLNPTTGFSPSRHGLSPVVAGVIGAVVTLAVAALLFGMVMLLGGVRLHRVHSKRRSELGGFKGGKKLASDQDLTLSKGGAGAVVVASEDPAYPAPVRGHERVGSWELKDQAKAEEAQGRVLSPTDVRPRRPSYEEDDMPINPFTPPVAPHNHHHLFILDYAHARARARIVGRAKQLVRRQRRYTVSRLLELAPQSRPAHFDLSKFTYDAARAGVVPPLGACAMSNRRTASDRPRGWSQESSSSQEEVILYRGNRIVNAPERQPTVPPSEHRAQQDEGFARFLKKHSSPTHQRVTAGGRIVPMEQRARPPVFSLPQANPDTEADRKNNTRDEVNGVTKPRATAQSEAKETMTDNNIPQPQPLSHSHVPGAAGVADACGTTAAANFNVLPLNSVFAYEGAHHQPNYLQAVTSAPYYPPVAGDGYFMQNPQLYTAGATPLPGFNNPFGLAFPLPYVPNPQILGLPPSCGITTTPTDSQPQEDGYNRHMLSESTANFEELDRQLKAIDRHRAMTELDPCLKDQRFAIAQLRGEYKSQMTYWSEKLGLDPKALAKNTTHQPNSTLNVKAATYVPLMTLPSPETFPIGTGNGSAPQTMQFEAERPKFDVRSTRRPIPIVPPPEDSPSPKKDVDDRAGSKTESIEVDEWGLRIGAPPPEIQRQQSQMLEQLVRESSISPLGSSENALIVTPGPSSQSISPQEHPGAMQEAQMMLEIGSESEEWLPTKPGRAPPTVEACYEVQLDAMRLPPGVTSKVRMPDGTITEVRGRGLQRPPSFEMDDFEKRYWTKKPIVTKEMWKNFVEVRACGDVSSIVDNLEFKAFGMERFVLRRRGLSG
ncbi:hypothetical protein CLAIMM_00921 isoform 2 [Cladophialophora immunda]|nr:hypothetical protein CLAIMM_00921 isoform 2 [Cladophialophora immunda]